MKSGQQPRRRWPWRKALQRRAAGLFRRAAIELLEPRTLLMGNPIISEFMADNETGLADEDQDHPDWIEIYNPALTSVNLDGYYLTDDNEDPDKWRIPAVPLDGQSYMVIFASGKDRAVAGQELHTNFRLDAEGDYLALVGTDGSTIVSEYAPSYPQQLTDVSYGLVLNVDNTSPAPPNAPVKVLVPGDDSLGTDWMGLALDDSGWTDAITGVGFERQSQSLPNEVEPNDSIATASVADYNFNSFSGNVYHLGIKGTITGGSDTDYYKIGALQANDVITISESGTASSRGTLGDPRANLYRANGTRVADDYDSGPGADALIARFTIAADDVYYFRARSQNSTTGTYQLGIWLEKKQGGTPPATGGTYTTESSSGNDNIGAAEDASTSWRIPQYLSRTAGTMESSVAVDYYRYQFTAGDLVTVNIDSTSTLNAKVSLLKSDGTVLALEDGTSGFASPYNLDSPVYAFIIPATGIYCLKVEAISGTSGAYNADVYLSSTTAPPSPTVWGSYSGQIATDIHSLMDGVNSTVYIRVPFTARDTVDMLKLRMKYDDGFAAYINGALVASRYAPATPEWNSAATAEHPYNDALVYEDFFIPVTPGLLLEGNNMLAIQGLNFSSGDSDFLIYPGLLGVETTALGERYFRTPTPGGGNSTGEQISFVEDTKFDRDRGFYDAPFSVTITTATAGATIRYTTNGSAPTATSGTLYTGPVPITTTTMLRAAAFKPGYVSTNVDTQTFIFLNDVIHQPAAPPGFPTTGIHWDYEMDPNVVNAYSSTIINDMKAVPSLSLVMNMNDLFGTTGIYSNPGGSGVAWERPVSAELICPDGSKGFQVNAGVRIYGGVNRSTSFPKHTFRLLFKEMYGAGKLKYDWFGDGAVEEFDTVVLRGEFNNSWPFWVEAERNRGQYIQDRWMSVTQLAMGQPSSRGNFVHLYVNGLYWGLYSPTERPDAAFAAAYLSGDKEQYDALNSSEPVDGDKNAWNTAQAIANGPGGPDNPTPDALASAEAYANLRQYVDVDNLIDYMILNFYGGNQDWDDHNWYAARKREAGAGFEFFNWDGERTLENIDHNRTGAGQKDKPSRLYKQLRANAEFRLLFADHVYEHLYNDGALTPAAASARYMELANEVDRAIVGESARWGDYHREPPYTRNVEWVAQRDWEINSYFPYRTTNLLNQLKGIALYPSVEAPSFSQHGGNIGPGFALTMSKTGGGTIYYTLDGTDPRLAGGAVSPTAVAYTAPVALDHSTTAKARVLYNGTWSAVDAAVFLYTMTTLRVTEMMYSPPAPPEGSPYSTQDFEYIEFQNIGPTALNISGAHFHEGVEFCFPQNTILASGARAVLVSNLAAFQSRYPGVAVGGVYLNSNLEDNGERITLVGAGDENVLDFTYDGNWYAIANGGGYSLVVINPAAPEASFSTKDNWRPSNLPNGAPGASDPGINPNTIVINEVLSNSASAAGTWVELRNTTTTSQEIGGWFLSDDPNNLTKWQIPSPKTVPANGYTVFTQSSHYGSALQFGPGGGAVYLSNNDGAGHPAGYRESVDFGPIDRPISFGQWVKSTGGTDFVAMNAQTMGQANTINGNTPVIGPAAINELMYHPTTGNDEFIELKNLTAAELPLYDVGHPENTWMFTAGITYSFPPGATIPAFGYVLVVPKPPDEFRAKYSIASGIPIYGPYTGALDNGGEDVKLARPAEPVDQTVPYILVDRVKYDNKAPWPISPDGDGPSLSRVNLGSYGNDPANWTAGQGGGTPGYANGQEPPIVDMGGDAVITAGGALTRTGYFNDPNEGQTWTAVVKWDSATQQSLPLNADKTFDLNHVYSQPGTFTILVTITDSMAGAGTDTLALSVLPNGPRQGSSSGDIYTLRLDPSGTYTQFFENIPTTANPTFYVSRNLLGPVAINGNGGNDQLRIDLTYGNPIPPDGLTFSGGDGIDLIQIIGTAGQQEVSAGGNQVSFGGATITFDTLERLQIDGKDGNDSLTITAALPFTPVFNGGTGPNAGNDALTVLGGTYDCNSDLQTGTANLTVRVGGTGTMNLNAAQHLVSLTANGSGTVNFNVTQQLLCPLIVAENGRAVVTAGGNKVLRLSNLIIMDNGALDLTDNDLIVQGDAWNREALLAATTALIRSGSNGGLWNGPGIISSTAANDAQRATGLAAMLNDKGGGAVLFTAFGGQTVDVNSVLVKYTWYGDTDLNGVTDADDYARIDYSYVAGGSGYRRGDFDYNGVIDVDDYFLIDSGFIGQSGVLSGQAAAKASPMAEQVGKKATERITPRTWKTPRGKRGNHRGTDTRRG